MVAISSSTAPPPASTFGTSSHYDTLPHPIAASSRSSGTIPQQIPPPPSAAVTRHELTAGSSGRQVPPLPAAPAPRSLPTASKKRGLLAFGEDSDEDDSTPSNAAERINSSHSFRMRQKLTTKNQKKAPSSTGALRGGGLDVTRSEAGPSCGGSLVGANPKADPSPLATTTV